MLSAHLLFDHLSFNLQAEKIVKLFLTFSTIKTLTDIALFLDSHEGIYETTSLEPLPEGLLYFNASSTRKLVFDLYKNVTNKGFIEISQALEKFTSLEILRHDLPDFPGITDEGLIQLGSALSRLASLASLGLLFSSFTQNFALALKSLPKLIHLKLGFKNANPSEGQVQQLSSSLKALKSSLKFLDITFAWQSVLLDSMLESL